MEKELEYFIKEKTKYCAPENWAFLVAQKLIDHGWIKPQPQATSELDELEAWVKDTYSHPYELASEDLKKSDFNNFKNGYQSAISDVLAKIDSLKSE